MKFRIDYSANKDFPKLAWFARVDRDSHIVSVIHGLSVEYRDDWMVEGVWDDDFERGNFHQSENFFGSGIRIEGEYVYFVPSSALVDRLLYCEVQGEILVSNSLIVLLGATGASLDDNHDYHRKKALSILKGVKNYDREFAVIHPRVKCFYQVFYENMVVTNRRLSFQNRSRHYEINSFAQYYGLLKEILLRIKDNYESEGRKNSVFAFTTLSSGYDSTAVSCLAKSLGVKTCFTGNSIAGHIDQRFIKRFISRHMEDSVPIAKRLGLDVQYLEYKCSNTSEDELYFICAPIGNAVGGPYLFELSFHSMASYIEGKCSVAIVFTGYHGENVWDANIGEEYLNDQIKRVDTSGIGLTEIRLKSGFINVAVPFILARNIEDIVKIARSGEMDQWRLNNSYDRPIARRIAEGSGVNRRLFGMRKIYTASPYQWPCNRRLRKQYFRYLKKMHSISPVFVFIHYILNRSLYLAQRLRLKSGYSFSKPPLVFFKKNLDFSHLMCHWAMRATSKKIARILR